jgi:MFS family permease
VTHLPGSSGAASRRGRAALGLALAAVYLARAIPAAVAESLRAELWLTDQALGTLASAFAGPFALALPVGAWLARDGRRRLHLFAAGLAVCAVATGGAALARGFWTLVLARCLAGAGAGLGVGATAGLLVGLDRVRGRALPGLAAAAAGSALAYALGGAAGGASGWQAAFWISGGAILAVAVLCLLPGDPARRGPDLWPDLRVRAVAAAGGRILADRVRLLGLTAAVSGAAAMGAFAYWLPAFLVRTRGIPQAVAGAELGAAVLASALVGAALARGALRRRASRPGAPAWIAAAGAGVAALGVSIALPWSEAIVFLPGVMAALLGVAAAVYGGVASARGREAVDPAALGLSLLAVHCLGEAGGPFALGALADRITFGRALFLIPALFLASGLLWAAAAWARDVRDGAAAAAQPREMASP